MTRNKLSFSLLQAATACIHRPSLMEIAARAMILALGILFLVSGLIINLIQAICFVVIKPFSKNSFRRINIVLVELLWLELVWLVDWWAGVKVQLFIDAETFQMMGKEHALLMCNHRSDIDWLVGWVLAQRTNCLGSSKALMKKSLKFLPVLGWSMWFSENLFLERNWAKDETTLESGLNRLKDYPKPFWLGLFVEGTRFTESKLRDAQEFASSKGWPIPKNVLNPRTKGFVAAVTHMRSFVPAIYDITVTIPKDSPSPTFSRIFEGQPSVVHVHLKRHSMKDLPETTDSISQWCKDRFLIKDQLLEKHKVENTFGDQNLHNLGRPVKSLVVVILWACLLIVLALRFLQSSAILSSWKGIGFSGMGLVIVTLLMQILIQFSQAEKHKLK